MFVKQFCQLADVIVVTTESLKKLYSTVSKNVVVIPNCVTEDMFRDREKKKNETTKILWSGSASHLPDLALIRQPLLDLKAKYGSKIEISLQGPLNFSEVFPDLDFVGYPSVPFDQYLNLIQDINPDIALGPLKANLFNASKSNLKFLQMSIMEAAFVGSSCGPYLETIDDGIDGMLCSSDEDWVSKISKLIDTPALVNKLAQSAFKTVKAKYMLDHHLNRWQQALMR